MTYYDLFHLFAVPPRFAVLTRVQGLVDGVRCPGVVVATHDDGSYEVQYETAGRGRAKRVCLSYQVHTMEQPEGV